jgi:hypothetical protein
MKTSLLLLSVLAPAATLAQVVTNLDANSIVVTSSKSVTLPATQMTFFVNASVDPAITLPQVLSLLNFGLTANDLNGVFTNNPPPPSPEAPPPPVQLTYSFRLAVPIASTNSTIDRLENLRKAPKSGMTITYFATTAGPSQAAADEAVEQLLPELVASARQVAQSLAAASQLRLGRIQSIMPNPPIPPGFVGAPSSTVTVGATVRFAAQ